MRCLRDLGKDRPFRGRKDLFLNRLFGRRRLLAASAQKLYGAHMHWTTPEERRAQGQARRKQIGRQQHDELRPKARPAPALTLLDRAGRGRVPSLLKLKYELMAQSAFGYFRGAVPVMAADLSVLPNTGIITQICGDAHVRNLGAFAAPDGRLVFDINDFDETIRVGTIF